MRALFFGSPEFAVPSLDALAAIADVQAVITQPDRRAGRGMKLKAPAVKERAIELGFEVMQPRKVRTAEFAERLRAFEADIAVVVAYGRILPPAVLSAPRRGCVNVHASLLPRWRGAAPIQWAIASGDAETGVCLMEMDEGLDTGAVISRASMSIDPDITAGALAGPLSTLGAELVTRDLAGYVAGELVATPQPEEGVTYAKLLEKSHGTLDFEKSAQSQHDLARGMSPWPGAQTTVAGRPLKVHATRVIGRTGALGAPGEILGLDEGALAVACAEGVLGLGIVQERGRKRVSAEAFMAGRGAAIGDILGRTEDEGERA